LTIYNYFDYLQISTRSRLTSLPLVTEKRSYQRRSKNVPRGARSGPSDVAEVRAVTVPVTATATATATAAATATVTTTATVTATATAVV
jgi:carbohydrate-binding DOMON domain-containing protein